MLPVLVCGAEMSYLIPAALDAPFNHLFYYQNSYATYMMEVPLFIYVIHDPGKKFKARTYRDRIEISDWFLAECEHDYRKLAYILAHEIGHQINMHHLVLYKWVTAGEVTGRLWDGTPITYPYVDWIGQWSLDFQVNDGLNRIGMTPPIDALTWSRASMFDREDDIYVRFYEQQGFDFNKEPPPSHNPYNNDVVPSDDSDRLDLAIRRENAFDKMVEVLIEEGKIDETDARGLTTAGMGKLAARLHPKPMKWFDIIRPRYRSIFAGRSRSWATYDRSAFAAGYVLQGRASKRAGHLVIILDTSGSMTEEETAHCIYHTGMISQQCNPKSILLLEVDMHVQRVTKFNNGRELQDFIKAIFDLRIKIRGNGGTMLTAGFKYLRNKKYPIDLLLVFTDMETNFPDTHEPAKECIWVSTRSGVEAPKGAGRTIYMNR
jgi:hypothetical protein